MTFIVDKYKSLLETRFNFHSIETKKRLIIIDDSENILSFEVVRIDNKKWVKSIGMNLDTGEEVSLYSFLLH